MAKEIKSTAESARLASRQGLSPSAAEFTPKAPAAETVPASNTALPMSSAAPVSLKPHRVFVDMVASGTSIPIGCDLAAFTLNELFLEVALRLSTTDLNSFVLSCEGAPLKISQKKVIDLGIGNCQHVTCQVGGMPPLQAAPMAQNSPVVHQLQAQLQQLQQHQHFLQQQKLQSQIAQAQAAVAAQMAQPNANPQLLQQAQYTLAINVNQLRQMQVASEWSLPMPPALPQGVGSPANVVPPSAYATPPPAVHMPAPVASPVPPPAVHAPVPATNGCVNLLAVAPKFSTYALTSGGSRALIAELQSQPNPVAIDRIIDDLEEVAGLATDRLSNEVMRHLVSVCTAEQSRRILAKFASRHADVLEMADALNASEILIQLVDNCRYEQCDEVDTLLRTVAANVLPFAQSTHTARKLVIRLLREVKADPDAVQALWNAILANVVVAAKDSKGCVTMKKCIDVAPPALRRDVQQIVLDALDELVVDQYGNYLLQHIVYNTASADNIGMRLLDHVPAYCTNKIASHVVERVLEECSPEMCQRIVEKVMSPAVLSKIIKDQYGNYIIQCAIERVPYPMLTKLQVCFSLM